MTKPEILTMTQTAAMMGVSLPTLIRLNKRGAGPDSFMVSNSRCSTPAAVREWRMRKDAGY